jgi:hypothetical protein
MAYQFSVGTIQISPTNGTPFTLGTVQDVSIDIDITLKELFGSYEFPVDIAPGTKKISGKAKFANISASQLNDLFFKGSLNPGTSTVTYTNQLVGTQVPSFQLVWTLNYLSKSWIFTLNKCISKKMTFSGKLEDYIIPDFDFQAFADSSNGVYSLVAVA